MLRRTFVALAATAGVASATLAVVPVAAAAPPPVSQPSIQAHFDFALGQTPENLVALPGGSVAVTLAGARQVVRVGVGGSVAVLATLPLPPDGGVNTPLAKMAVVTGLTRASDGHLYALYATGDAATTGLWRITPGRAPVRIAALPADGFPNGVAYDRATKRFYATDSALGTIWSIPREGGTARRWAKDRKLDPANGLGANGIKVHAGAVWASNSGTGSILRIRIRRDGSAGAVSTWARSLPDVDDFDFTGSGNQLLAALNASDRVVLVGADRKIRTVLRRADGLQNPSSVAVRGRRVYVTSAAYTTMTDPNLLRAHLQIRR